MSELNNLSGRARRELSRALANHRYERTDGGIVVPSMKLSIGGFFEVAVGDGPYEIAPNLIPTEGLNHILDVALSQATQKLAFYIALFSGNVTPQATWTGANWVANATEFTNYAEATRQAWAEAGVAAGSVTNSASPASFTIGAGGGTVRGAALVEASAKSATTGVLVAAARLPADKVLAETEELRIIYTMNASST